MQKECLENQKEDLQNISDQTQQDKMTDLNKSLDKPVQISNQEEPDLTRKSSTLSNNQSKTQNTKKSKNKPIAFKTTDLMLGKVGLPTSLTNPSGSKAQSPANVN